MRQLGELNKNGAKEFEELGVEVVAVFREEREGLAGLKKIKVKTKAPFTLAIDTPKKATAAYSNGRMKFHNYVVDKNGVIQGVIDGSLRSRAQAEKLLEIVKSADSDSAGMAAADSGDDKAAVQQTVMDYAKGVLQGKTDLIKEALHPDAKMFGLAASGDMAMQKDYLQIMKAVASRNATGEMAKAGPKVDVLDVTGDLASVKLTSPRRAAMMQLVKVDGKWKILQILSQMNSK